MRRVPATLRRTRTVTGSRLPQVFLMAVMCVTGAPMPLSAKEETQAPDFNGIWGKYTYSYPKPYMKGREIANGYGNEYLMPWVVEALDRDELVSANGRAIATAHSL